MCCILFDSSNRRVLSSTTLGSQPSRLLTTQTHGGECLKKPWRKRVANLVSQRYFQPLPMLVTSGRLVYRHSVSLLWKTHLYCSTIIMRSVSFISLWKKIMLYFLPSPINAIYTAALTNNFWCVAVSDQRWVPQRNWDIWVCHQGAGHSQTRRQRRWIKGWVMRWPYPALVKFLQFNWSFEITLGKASYVSATTAKL